MMIDDDNSSTKLHHLGYSTEILDSSMDEYGFISSHRIMKKIFFFLLRSDLWLFHNSRQNYLCGFHFGIEIINFSIIGIEMLRFSIFNIMKIISVMDGNCLIMLSNNINNPDSRFIYSASIVQTLLSCNRHSRNDIIYSSFSHK